MVFPKLPNASKPFIIMVAGVTSDYVSSLIGISVGYVETHPNYSPLNALIIFTLALAILMLFFWRNRTTRIFVWACSIIPFIGIIHNLLVFAEIIA